MKEKEKLRLLGSKIRALRAKRKITQQAAADQYGCTLRTWQRFEQGRNIRFTTLLKLSQLLRVHPKQLVGNQKKS